MCHTNWSIGLMIKGIENNPIPMTVQDLVVGETYLFLPRSHFAAAHILLIVSPGIITEANPCHRKVSNIAMYACL